MPPPPYIQHASVLREPPACPRFFHIWELKLAGWGVGEGGGGDFSEARLNEKPPPSRDIINEPSLKKVKIMAWR